MRIIKLIAILGLTLITALALPAQTVRVIFTSGEATIQRPDEAALRPIVKGESVVIGTRIVTGADGRVVLTPMPGVKSIVAPNTTLLLESVSENRTSPTEVTHQAVIDLKQGAVVSDLQKPEGVSYDYSIRTARGLAGARGTTFTVGINPAGIQTIVVAHGSIAINFLDGRTATLSLGQLSITNPVGETQSVGKVSELSPANQAIAQNWTETTVAALASAIESGVEVSPEALKNALAAAESLGVTLSPELQALVDRVLAILAVPTTTNEGVDTTTIKEVVAEDRSESFDPDVLANYRESLQSEDLQLALDALISDGDFTQAKISQLLSDDTFKAELLPVLTLYSVLDSDERGLLKQLGIIGDKNIAAIGTDPMGLITLVDAYLDLAYYNGGTLDVKLLAETNYPNSGGSGYTISETIESIPTTHFFFPGKAGASGVTIHDVTFDALGESLLTVGATRELKIDNTGYNGVAFKAGDLISGTVELRASDLVSLTNTIFAPEIGYVLIEAATINLKDVSFAAYSYVNLKSKLGVAGFASDGSNGPGKVNFLGGVTHGGNSINNPTELSNHSSYINIGTQGQGGGN